MAAFAAACARNPGPPRPALQTPRSPNDPPGTEDHDTVESAHPAALVRSDWGDGLSKSDHQTLAGLAAPPVVAYEVPKRHRVAVRGWFERLRESSVCRHGERPQAIDTDLRLALRTDVQLAGHVNAVFETRAPYESQSHFEYDVVLSLGEADLEDPSVTRGVARFSNFKHVVRPGAIGDSSRTEGATFPSRPAWFDTEVPIGLTEKGELSGFYGTFGDAVPEGDAWTAFELSVPDLPAHGIGADGRWEERSFDEGEGPLVRGARYRCRAGRATERPAQRVELEYQAQSGAASVGNSVEGSVSLSDNRLEFDLATGFFRSVEVRGVGKRQNVVAVEAYVQTQWDAVPPDPS